VQIFAGQTEQLQLTAYVLQQPGSMCSCKPIKLQQSGPDLMIQLLL
jgi:hypothetical protein